MWVSVTVREEVLWNMVLACLSAVCCVLVFHADDVDDDNDDDEEKASAMVGPLATILAELGCQANRCCSFCIMGAIQTATERQS